MPQCCAAMLDQDGTLLERKGNVQRILRGQLFPFAFAAAVTGSGTGGGSGRQAGIPMLAASAQGRTWTSPFGAMKIAHWPVSVQCALHIAMLRYSCWKAPLSTLLQRCGASRIARHRPRLR